MKILLHIQEQKNIDKILEMLKRLPFVKAEIISDSKAETLKEIQAAIEEINLVKKGELKTRSIQELLNEI